MIKLLKKLALSCVLLGTTSLSYAGAITPNPVAPSIAGTAFILMDHDSGTVIAESNADERLPPASIVKLMTAYVVSHEIYNGNIKLEDEVSISEKAWRMIGSRSFIEVNTKVPVEALLRGMIVQSGNDAAVALAEHVAGSEEVFAQMMNQYAQRLGMTNTNYTNSTGLPDDNQYSSARDIAKISSAMIRDFPDHYKWYSEKEYTYNNITQNNRNQLLWRDSSVDGLKTGHTQAAGYCLSASAKRDGMRLMAVVMGTRSEASRAQEIQKLFNYGFRFFETHQLYAAGQKITESKVWKGEQDAIAVGLQKGLSITVPRGQYQNLQAISNLQQPIVAPISAGTELGEVEIRLNDEIITTQRLVALNDVPQGSWWRRIIDSLLMMVWG